MPNLIILFNHTLTAIRKAGVRVSLGIASIIDPPSVQAVWERRK